MGGFMKQLIIATVVLFVAVGAFAKSKAPFPAEVTVTSKEVTIKKEKSHLSKAEAKAMYGDKLKVTDKQEDWYLVTSPDGSQGWVHISSVTTKKINFKKDATVTEKTTTHEEVALAGKGFNKQVETAYVTSNPSIADAYKKVDQVESFRVPAAQLSAFIKQGQLK